MAAVAHGLDAAILYRRPNIASADRAIQEMRAVKMGTLIPAGRDAPIRLAEALRISFSKAAKAAKFIRVLVDCFSSGCPGGAGAARCMHRGYPPPTQRS